MNFDDFKKIELKVAEILSAERVTGSEKLVKLEVSLGNDPLTSGEQVKRQIVAGIGLAYAPESLIGKKIVIVANLEPRMLMGLESQGMLLAATDPEGLPVLLSLDKDVPLGSGIR